LSQDEVARAAAMTRGALSRHERSHPQSNPSLNQVIRLASALDVPVSALFDCPGTAVPGIQPRLRDHVPPAAVAHHAGVDYCIDGLLRHLVSLRGHARTTFIQAVVMLLTMSTPPLTIRDVPEACPAGTASHSTLDLEYE
jgi:transcriptional regulator with XRE-family HTH domain